VIRTAGPVSSQHAGTTENNVRFFAIERRLSGEAELPLWVESAS